MHNNPLHIRRLDHVVIRVRDVQAAVAFYRDVLGCAMDKVQERIGLYQLRAGDSLLDLVDVDGQLGRDYPAPPAPDAPNMDHFCVQVEPWDADAIIAYLHGHGVDAGSVQQRYGALGNGPSLYIRDPDGNTVELKGPPDAQQAGHGPAAA